MREMIEKKRHQILALNFFIIMGLDWSAYPKNNFLFNRFSSALPMEGVWNRYFGMYGLPFAWILTLLTTVSWVWVCGIAFQLKKNYGDSAALKCMRRLALAGSVFYVFDTLVVLSAEFFGDDLISIIGGMLRLNEPLTQVRYPKEVFWRYAVEILCSFQCMLRWLMALACFLAVLDVLRRHQRNSLFRKKKVVAAVCVLISGWQMLLFPISNAGTEQQPFWHCLYLFLHIVCSVLLLFSGRALGKIKTRVFARDGKFVEIPRLCFGGAVFVVLSVYRMVIPYNNPLSSFSVHSASSAAQSGADMIKNLMALLPLLFACAGWYLLYCWAGRIRAAYVDIFAARMLRIMALVGVLYYALDSWIMLQLAFGGAENVFALIYRYASVTQFSIVCFIIEITAALIALLSLVVVWTVLFLLWSCRGKQGKRNAFAGIILCAATGGWQLAAQYAFVLQRLPIGCLYGIFFAGNLIFGAISGVVWQSVEAKDQRLKGDG